MKLMTLVSCFTFIAHINKSHVKVFILQILLLIAISKINSIYAYWFRDVDIENIMVWLINIHNCFNLNNCYINRIQVKITSIMNFNGFVNG